MTEIGPWHVSREHYEGGAKDEALEHLAGIRTYSRNPRREAPSRDGQQGRKSFDT